VYLKPFFLQIPWSGGHSFEGFSSIDNGLQLNLSLMNNISWKGNDVKIESACLLRELYDSMLPKKRIIPSGSCGTVGVGGLTLGGGYGFFSRKYGLTCDSLVGATMVDGTGKIHKVSGKDELLWGLKGGGNGNFGAVTEFEFRTHPAPPTFTRYRFKAYKLDTNRTKELLKAYFKYSKDLPNTCFAAFVLNYKTLVLLLTDFGNGSPELENFIENFKKITDKFDEGATRDLDKALHYYYGVEHPIPFKNASAGYYQNYQSIKESLDQILPFVFKKRGLIYQINTLGGNINNKEFEENSCYPHRDQPYLSELQAYWEEGQNPSALLASFDSIQSILQSNGLNKQYRNYPNIKFPDWETAYYGNNYKRLQELKKKYDPDDLFSNGQTISLPKSSYS